MLTLFCPTHIKGPQVPWKRAFIQPVSDLDQREIPLHLDPAQDLYGMRLNTMTVAIATDGFGRNTAVAFIALTPEHRRHNRDVELRRRPSA